MEHSHFFEQDHGYTTTLALAAFGAQFYKQRFNIAPLDVSACRAGEDQFNTSLVLPPQAEIVPRSGTELDERTSRRPTRKGFKSSAGQRRRRKWVAWIGLFC